MKIVINPKYEFLRAFIKNLPTDFDKLGEIIYDGRNVIKVISVDGLNINVKWFKEPNFINRFVYGFFRKSKAKRSYQYANILLQKEINTPEPISYSEEKNLLGFKHSFYVSLQEDFDGLMREFKWGKLQGRENLLTQFAQFTASMHEKEVLHIDYSPGNILYKKQGDNYSFYLVDLNRMKFGKVSFDEGCANFRRLWGNDEMISFIASEYAKARGFNEKECVDLVLFYHKKFWENFSKRHKDKTPYISE